MSNYNKLVATLEELASPTASAIKDRFSERTRPRIALLLIDAGTIAARKSMGEDTTTAEIALESSFANIALEERTVLQTEARNMLIRALLKLAGVIAGA